MAFAGRPRCRKRPCAIFVTLDRARKNSLMDKADVLPDTLPEPSFVSNGRKSEDGQSRWKAMWNLLRFKV